MPSVVALSGGVACGKTTIANLFAELGVPIIDADIIARQVVVPNSTAFVEIVHHFSDEILLPSGELDRSQLREIIFNNDHERLWLNSLLHPLIAAETRKQIAQITAPYLIWVIPLLIENGLTQFADRILIIETSPELQLERLIKRDHIDKTLAIKMVEAQTSNDKRLTFANDLIKNDGNLVDLTNQVAKLHQRYLTLFNRKII